jgi:predicted TPR repeat methyltransferase
MTGPQDPVETARELIAAGKPRDAIALLNSLIEESRGGVLTRVTLGRAQLAAGDAKAALATLREANFLAPNLPLTAIALGEALLASGALPTAVAEFQRALRLDPESGEAHWHLAQAWLDAGEPDKAKDHLNEAKARGGRLDSDIVSAMTEADEMAKAPRSAAGYVRHLFDQFSADYDQRMIGSLGYRVPQILFELSALVGAPNQDIDILDLGCGTGLCGEVFKTAARRLVFVDLSPKMIDKARERKIYDELVVGDVEHYLKSTRDVFDLCLAADVLVYLGDLRGVVSGVAKHLRRGGLFLLTVEAASDDGFALGPKKRWQHSEPYLREIADDAGFEVAGLLSCVPRHDAGLPISGFAVALRR